MRKSSLSPLDIVGITLGVIVILIVAGAVAFVVRTGALVEPGRWWGAWERVGDLGTIVGGSVTEEKDEQVAGRFTRLELRNVAGDVQFTATDAASVGVHSVKSAWSTAGLETVRVAIEQRGDTLVIEEKRDLPIVGRTGSITFSVAVPASVREIDAKSVSGSITVRGLAAGVAQRLNTVSGRIDTDRSGDLRASTISGSVSFVFEGSRLEASSISGTVRGTIDGLARAGSVEISSVSGSVHLEAWPGLDAEISLRSLSGSVSCDFPLTVTSQRNNQLRGRIGGGAASVDVHTTSGSIGISKL